MEEQRHPTRHELDTPWYSKSLKNGYRIGGVKLSFDGSPQGKTAFLSQPYFIPPHGQPASFRGYPAIPPEEVNRKIALCYEKNWQFLAHCNGDAAGDMMLGAVKDAREKARQGQGPPRRDDSLPDGTRGPTRHHAGVRRHPVDVALKSLTIWPAYHHYEEANRGSIEVGKLADFVVLDQNPHKVPILGFADLKVQETIKEGKTIYRAN